MESAGNMPIEVIGVVILVALLLAGAAFLRAVHQFYRDQEHQRRSAARKKDPPWYPKV